MSGSFWGKGHVCLQLWDIVFPSRESWFTAYYKRFGFSKLRESSCATQPIASTEDTGPPCLVLWELRSGEMVHDNSDTLPTAMDASNKVLCL